MAVTSRDGDGSFVDSEFVDVETGREIYGCRHGTEFVYSHQVIFERDWGRVFRVEFPSDDTMLDIEWFCIIPNYNVWFRRFDFGTA